MSKRDIRAFLILLFALSTSGFSQVSDTILKALEGENVKIELDRGNDKSKKPKRNSYLWGKLQKVATDSIVVIDMVDSRVREIPKASILAIETIKKTPKKLLNHREAGTLGFFIGFGIGSYLQGDKKGGTAGLVWDLLNGVSAGIFFGLISVGGGSVITYVGIIGASVFFTSLVASRLFQAVRPHKWYKKNLALLEGFYLVPDLAPNGQVRGLKGGLTYTVQF